jgi:hypothetical protein
MGRTLGKENCVRGEVEQPFLLTSFHQAAHNLKGIHVNWKPDKICHNGASPKVGTIVGTGSRQSSARKGKGAAGKAAAAKVVPALRKRVPAWCKPCLAKMLRCSRSLPCSSCVEGGDPKGCVWEGCMLLLSTLPSSTSWFRHPLLSSLTHS